MSATSARLAAAREPAAGRLLAIINQSADGILIVDGEGRVAFANPAASMLFNRTVAELEEHSIGLPLGDGTSEIQVWRPDGSRRTAEMRAVAVEWDGKPATLASLRDITMRKDLEQQLRLDRQREADRADERAAELAETTREMESFAYAIAHDIRAPLRSIDGWTLAVLEDFGGQLDQTGQGYLARVREEAQRMGRLIDGLLELSRVVRVPLHLEAVDLSAMARALAAQLTAAHAERCIEFELEPGLEVRADARLLRVALGHLFENAVKFTARRPVARVRFGFLREAAGDSYYLSDNGVGFNMAYAGRLFTAFHRLHPPAEFPGIGIGLAVVSRILRRHGGWIAADAAPERGATFRFTIGRRG
jgi:light-regulated signal transduction histidine kinase (bacteriophytochrome)